MATFINQKEEVLEVKLTPKGKELFSKGQFKPFYYSFYDSEVIYDGEYAGIKEIQNSIVDRIKERARTKVVTNYGQVPALQDQNYEALLSSSAEYFRVLGTNSPWTDFAPAWSVSSIGTSTGFSGSASQGVVQYKSALSIPTLTSKLTTKYRQFTIGEDGEEEFTSIAREEQDNLTLDILEMNTIFKGNGNYTVEVFRIPDPINNPDNLVRLQFLDRNSKSYVLLKEQEDPNIFQNPQLALSLPEPGLEIDFPVLDETYVEYYMNFRLDREIIDAPAIRSTSAYVAGRPDDTAVICADRDPFPPGYDS